MDCEVGVEMGSNPLLSLDRYVLRVDSEWPWASRAMAISVVLVTVRLEFKVITLEVRAIEVISSMKSWVKMSRLW